MNYKPKSKYIKSKIKGKSFSNVRHREYIDDLIKLEQLLVNGHSNMSGAMSLSYLKDKHPVAFKAILKEIDPKGYKRWLQLEVKEKKQHQKEKEKYEKMIKIEEQKQKNVWVALGGV